MGVNSSYLSVHTVVSADANAAPGDRKVGAPLQLRIQKKLSDVVLCFNNRVPNAL